MGTHSHTTTVHGWIEYRDGFEWKPAVRIDELANSGNSYNLFGLLFGVRNDAGFVPVAPGRGIPPNCSPFVRAAFEKGSGFRGESWAALDEVRAVKLKHAKKLDPFFHAYHLETGEEVSALLALSDYEHARLHSDRRLRKGPLELRIERLRRKDVVTRGWAVLVAMMDCLAAGYGGGENVRIVCWFDDLPMPRLGERVRLPGHSVYKRN